MNILIYLLISFIVSWSIWFGLNALGLFGTLTYTIISALIMWLPAASVAVTKLITKRKAIAFSWKPSLRKNLKFFLLAWFLPIILTSIGCIVYFLVFKENFTMQILETTSMELHQFLLLAIATIIPGSIFNMFFALGEEIGWRGFLTPELSKKSGRTKAYILTGIIWGVWHTPVNIMGYNYGLGYSGYPITGIVAMCLSCIVLGTWCSYLAEKTESIWAPALFHGSINAAGAMGLMFLRPGTPYLLGPGITGIIPSVITGLLFIPFMRRKHND